MEAFKKSIFYFSAGCWPLYYIIILLRRKIVLNLFSTNMSPLCGSWIMPNLHKIFTTDLSESIAMIVP